MKAIDCLNELKAEYRNTDIDWEQILEFGYRTFLSKESHVIDEATFFPVVRRSSLTYLRDVMKSPKIIIHRNLCPTQKRVRSQL